ncbi:hypothetical protein JKF63_03992 [Porcisia hertigi]|uniref:Large ribosomal subunit protein bL12 C-terminal domain-containing protein n=1 Tax=Porcisia hertigi TaxID=2761500 RepID=A0A836IHG4_9TRYP|nr:hypothetical protein JKF63_03992 [Porcisia hertigi]
MQQMALACNVARRSVAIAALFTPRRAIISGVASNLIPRGMAQLGVRESAEVVERLAEEYVNMDMATMTAFHKKAMSKMLLPSGGGTEPAALNYEDRLLQAMGGGGSLCTSARGAAAAPPAGDSDAGGADRAAPSGKKAPEKTAFDVALKKFPAENKIKLIKELRSVCGLSIQEAKMAIEKCPGVIARQLSKPDAEKLEGCMVKLGAEVELV